jgi:ribosomal RNA-processing protein 36
LQASLPLNIESKQEEHKMPPLSSKLGRKLRAAEESSDDSENYEVTDRSSSESVLEFGAGEVVDSDSEDEVANGSQDEEMVSVTVQDFV